MGIYLSPADLFQIEDAAGYYGDRSSYADTLIPTDPASFKSEPTKARKIPSGAPGSNVAFACKADSYNRYFLNQLFELLTEYGPVDEVWFDGATPKTKGGQQYAYASGTNFRKLQPEAVIFGKGPDVRWAGNEAGMARETEWSVVGLDKPEAEFQWPDMYGDLGSREICRRPWHCTGILPRLMYPSCRAGSITTTENMKSADTLMDLYEKSVGRNASFILNIPPDKCGLFTDAEVASLKAFGQRRQSLYGQNLATGDTVTASSSLPDHLASDATRRPV